MTTNIKVRSLYQVPGKDLYCLAFRTLDERGYPTGEDIEFHLSTQELWEAITQYLKVKESLKI